jgi:hypothetical protein
VRRQAIDFAKVRDECGPCPLEGAADGLAETLAGEIGAQQPLTGGRSRAGPDDCGCRVREAHKYAPAAGHRVLSAERAPGATTSSSIRKPRPRRKRWVVEGRKCAHRMFWKKAQVRPIETREVCRVKAMAQAVAVPFDDRLMD